jgi:hypothetical protein
VKYGVGKKGAVRYDPADLERFVESRKKRAMPVVETQAPTAPVAPMPVPVEPEALVEEPVEQIEPPMPVRRVPPRTPWEAMAERYAEEAEDEEPFAVNHRGAHRPGRYWSR